MSTISEWLIAIADVIFFATFYKEFKQFRVKPPTIVYYNSETMKEAMPSVKSVSESVPA